MKYIVNFNYRNNNDVYGTIVLEKGKVLTDPEPDFVDFLNRDAPGVVSEKKEKEPEEKLVVPEKFTDKGATQNRMVTSGGNKRK